MINIYHTQTTSCKKTVALLKDSNRFNFIPVELGEIPKIPETEVLLWGDGREHHFSSLRDERTIKKGRIKLNIDQHSDTFFYSDDIETVPTYWNHMAITAFTGLMTGLVMPRKCKRIKWKGHVPGLKNKTECWLPNIVYVNQNEIFSLDKQIQATIDLDCVNNFPVFTCFERDETWVLFNEGFENNDLLTICEDLNKKRAIRMDVGGLWIPSPEFISDLKELEDISHQTEEYRLSKVYESFSIKKSIKFLEEVLCILTQ